MLASIVKRSLYRGVSPIVLGVRSFADAAPKPRRKVTASTILSKYRKGEKITMCTAYTYPEAIQVDQAGIDMILVGDSVGMTDMGYSSTLPVNLEDTILFCKCVTRGAKYPLIIGDMPYGSYEESISQCIHNCIRVVKEGNVGGIKLEGGVRRQKEASALSQCGIAVMGHIGLTPQAVGALGGFKIQGKSFDAVMKLIEDAKALEEAGCFSIVLECVPEIVGHILTKSVHIPTIGIGAGAHCSGQVLVYHDLLGVLDHPLKPKSPPSFCKQYANIAKIAHEALVHFNKDVKEQRFPAPENCAYKIPEEEKEKMMELLEKVSKEAGIKTKVDLTE
ncbi:hypothetical protein WA538_005995, partial [Blastocystis sp. DL]